MIYRVQKWFLKTIFFAQKLPRLAMVFPSRLRLYANRKFLKRIPSGALIYKELSNKEDHQFWSNEATLPGETQKLPIHNIDSIRVDDLSESQDNIKERRLRIFSVMPYDISDKSKSNDFLENLLPTEFRESYQCIDWHKDFSSGYSWGRDIDFSSIKVAPQDGAEIKVPRELSRFQHICYLPHLGQQEGAMEFIAQVLDWIDNNSFQKGVNWACTMDVALRAVSWVWGLRFFENELSKYSQACLIIKESLYNHGRHIEHNLEYYKISTGNHYLSDLAGLIYIAAAFPEFEESDRWLLFGIQELNSEMEREVYDDGYAHEGSSHYHRLVAELFFSCTALVERMTLARRKKLMRVNPTLHDVKPKLTNRIKRIANLNSSGKVFPENYYVKLLKMGRITEVLTKPNGLVPQFGDNDSARAHKLVEGNVIDYRDHRLLYGSIYKLFNVGQLSFNEKIEREVQLLTGGLQLDFSKNVKSLIESFKRRTDSYLFPDAGIAIIKKPPIYLAVTCGQNGQNDRGGHNHNDKLSFELAYFDEDIIVDGGCPVYTANPGIRNRYRSTLSHNTLTINGQEQDPLPKGPGGLFLLPGRSFPKIALKGNNGILGRHFGFAVPHKRTFDLEGVNLIITDLVKSDLIKTLSFNLSPDVLIDLTSFKNGVLFGSLTTPKNKIIHLSIEGITSYELRVGAFGIGYGEPVANELLFVTTNKRKIVTTFSFK